MLIYPDMHRDARGFFCEAGHGLDLPSRFCTARSSHAVLRGLHVRAGAGEEKLVRCTNGAIFDVVVDLRGGKLQGWTSLLLTDEEQLTLRIPAGCAHGYQVITPSADVTYQISGTYNSDEDLVIAWNDPDLAIRWPLRPGPMSERDRTALPLSEVLEKLSA
jgi:dTDP-4-dehydrorhamnose 3,5-epimerase